MLNISFSLHCSWGTVKYFKGKVPKSKLIDCLSKTCPAREFGDKTHLISYRRRWPKVLLCYSYICSICRTSHKLTAPSDPMHTSRHVEFPWHGNHALELRTHTLQSRLVVVDNSLATGSLSRPFAGWLDEKCPGNSPAFVLEIIKWQPLVKLNLVSFWFLNWFYLHNKKSKLDTTWYCAIGLLILGREG